MRCLKLVEPLARRSLLVVLVPLSSMVANAQQEYTNMQHRRTEEAIALMMDFAHRTGLNSEMASKRYLWTDAFAVCNFLGLARVTRDTRYRELALRLVDQVHRSLGRHRPDDSRSGWISGLGDKAGEAHPTRGGLRIGKELPEHAADEPFNERQEWDRDGQYFHYLTKWMHALDQIAHSTRRPEFNLWARELAATAFAAFSYQPASNWAPRRMYWKMSIDLSRPLVHSMGQHDPLDGYITFLQLRATAATLSQTEADPDLEDETRQLADMVRRGKWATADPLGLGGLLMDAYRVEQLMQQGAVSNRQLVEDLLDAALAGLQHYAKSRELQLPLDFRLAFREIGLAIGLHAAELMRAALKSGKGPASNSARVRAQLESILRYASMREEIEAVWRGAAKQNSHNWSEHLDINQVMLATSLLPEGCLILQTP